MALPSPGHIAARLNAPHRLWFALGALLWGSLSLWWATLTVANALGAAPAAWAVAPTVAHGLALSLGFMPAFIAGFLFTAGPKWLALPPLPMRCLRWPAGLWGAGWGLLLPGLHLDVRLAAAGAALATVAWIQLCRLQHRLLRASGQTDRLHARALGAALWVIAAALAALTLALATSPDPTVLRAATRLGLWGLASVFITASHRLTPFLHPAWLRRLPGGLLGPLQLALLLRLGLIWICWAWAHPGRPVPTWARPGSRPCWGWPPWSPSSTPP